MTSSHLHISKTAAISLSIAGFLFCVPLFSAAPAQSPRPLDAKAIAAAAQREADEMLARTYMATKRYPEAATLYEKLIKSNPREPSYPNLAGIAHMQTGDLKKARSLFQRATKVEPRFADAYNNLGATFYTQKNFKRALEYYQRASALQPGVAAYHTNVGYAFFSLKKPVEAEEEFRRAILMDPFVFQQNSRNGSVLQDRSVADKGLFAYTMAQSFAGAGDARLCAAYLRRAIDEGYKDLALVYTDPKFAAVLNDPDVQAVLTLAPAAGTQAAAPAEQPVAQ